MDPSTIITLLTLAPPLVKRYRDRRDDFLDYDNLDDYQQRFADTFETELKRNLGEDVQVDGVVATFESNREEIIPSIGDQQIADVSTVVENVSDQLATVIFEEQGSAIDDRGKIHTAVKEAYQTTIDEIVQNIDEDDRSRLNTEFNRVIQRDITEIDDTLQEVQTALQENLRLEKRHKPYRIERDQGGIDSLIAEKITQRLDHEYDFQEPPEFGSHLDHPFVLIYGRKGSGKTRVLNETSNRLVTERSFDAVIYLNRGFRELRNLESLLQVQYEGDVLLIWDDAHDLGDRSIVESVLTTFDEHLTECGDHELWVRMTARREELDGVLEPSQHPDRRSSHTYTADITPRNTELGTLPVDTDTQFDKSTVASLVEKSLTEHNISDPEDLTDDFVAAVLEYEPTPAYIESACQTIADQEGVLREHHIESLPDSTLSSWEQSYRELRNSSQYGESRQAILKSIAVLNWINAPIFATSIIRHLTREAFEIPEAFRPDLEYLDSRGWVNIRDSPDRVEIHDIRLEAIETPTHASAVIEGVSTVLGEIARGEIELPAAISDDYASALNSSFAQQLQVIGNIGLAEEHFRLAARTTAATPDVHQAYAEFLYTHDRPEEARIQRQIASEMRSDRNPRSIAFQKLRQQIEANLTTWRTNEDDSKFRHEKTEKLLDEDTTTTTADWTQEAYSKSDQPNQSSKPPSKKERARAHIQTEKQQYKKKINAIQQLLASDLFESVSPPADLFTTLRRSEFEDSEDLLAEMQTSDTATGVITDILSVKEILTKKSNLDTNPNAPRVKQSKEQTYSDIFHEDFSTDDQPSTSDSLDYLQTLIELDSGLNKWLLYLDEEATTDVINMTVDEAKNIILRELSSDPIIEQIEAKLRSKYCRVIQTPGAGMDELIVGDGTTQQNPPLVRTSKVYPQPSSTGRAADSSIATRTMVKELRAATRPIRGVSSPSTSSGVLLPTGERADHVCICGQIAEGETIDNDFWWTKLRDVYGDSILLLTEDYHDRGQRNISTEHPVIVTGIPKPVEIENGGKQVAIELRTISNVSLQSCWLTAIEIGTQTIDRIDRFDADPGLSELSRQEYDISSAEALDQYRETAEAYTQLI